MSKLRTIIDSLSVGWDWSVLASTFKQCKGPHPSEKKHLALFAWALPPASSAGVHRPLSFIRHGASADWQIDAFHGKPAPDQRKHGEELLARVPQSTLLREVPDSHRMPSYRLFPVIDGGFIHAIEYAKFSIRCLADNPPTVVMASGPPFFVFVAAYYVAQHFHAPLVLDYRDEWSECPFDFVSHGAHDRVWEARCLGAASAVVFTTESHRQHQLRMFPELTEGKTHLIPNGWEPSDFVANAPTTVAENSNPPDVVTLSHVGVLAGHSSPKRFLDNLEQVLKKNTTLQDNLRIRLVGRRTAEVEARLSVFAFQKNLELIDPVGKRAANQFMQESDALLLLSSSDLERYLPSKLFDYIAAGRPILVYGTEGESSRLIESLGVGLLSLDSTPSELELALRNIGSAGRFSNNEKLSIWLEQHRRDTLAARLFEILTQLSFGHIKSKRSN